MKPDELNFSINPSGRVIVLPSVSAYVGADTVAAVISTGMHNKEDISLLVDVGTNGEIVLGNSSFLYSCLPPRVLRLKARTLLAAREVLKGQSAKYLLRLAGHWA